MDASSVRTKIRSYIESVLQDARQNMRVIDRYLSDQRNQRNQPNQLNQQGGVVLTPAIVRDKSNTVIDFVRNASAEVDQKTLEGFGTTLRNFAERLEGVLTDINKMDVESAGLEVENVYRQYDNLIQNVGASQNLEQLQTSDGRIVFRGKSNKKQKPAYGLIELFSPLISSYELLERLQSTGDKTEAAKVFNAISGQLNLNNTLLRNLSSILNDLDRRIQSRIQINMPIFKAYEFEIQQEQQEQPGQPGQPDRSKSITASYKVDEHDVQYVLKLEDGSAIAAADRMVDVKVDVDLSTSVCSLESIRTGSITQIETCIKLLAEQAKQAKQAKQAEPASVASDSAKDMQHIRNSLSELYKINMPSMQIMQKGGVSDEKQAHAGMYDFMQRMEDINRHLSQIQTKITAIEDDRINMEYYILYVGQAGMPNTHNMKMYRYIGLDTLQKYAQIMQTASTDPYFIKYHKIVRRRMSNLINSLIRFYADAKIDRKYIINIRHSTGPLFDDFVLFNHFSNMLDAFKAEHVQEHVQEQVSPAV